MADQSFKNHAKFDPIYHFFLAPVAVANVVVELYAMYRRPTYSELWFLILAIAFLVAVFKLRSNALGVQDRVIRLEETLRMQHVLPASMQGEIAKLHRGQFIALRFAPDSELPSLVQQTIANNWHAKDIKGAIKNWKPDHFRV